MTESPQQSATPSRRQLLATGGTAVLTAVAGCADIINFIAGGLLEDVNVFNQTDEQVGGTVRVLGPSGAIVLDETFELVPSGDEGGENDSTAVFEDVWQGAGTYEATLELDDTEVDGQAGAATAVTIDDPDEEMLGIPLGADEADEPIDFRLGEDLTELHES